MTIALGLSLTWWHQPSCDCYFRPPMPSTLTPVWLQQGKDRIGLGSLIIWRERIWSQWEIPFHLCAPNCQVEFSGAIAPSLSFHLGNSPLCNMAPLRRNLLPTCGVSGYLCCILPNALTANCGPARLQMAVGQGRGGIRWLYRCNMTLWGISIDFCDSRATGTEAAQCWSSWDGYRISRRKGNYETYWFSQLMFITCQSFCSQRAL